MKYKMIILDKNFIKEVKHETQKHWNDTKTTHHNCIC